MILSHKHRFIFLKTNKTAGTSIEIALSQFCGPDDIITPIPKKDEQIREELGFRGPQNYGKPPTSLAGRAWRKLFGSKEPRFYNHMPASELKPLVGDAIWNSYFKFCFERNPWDRVVSMYYWHNKEEPRPSMEEFIRSDKIDLLEQRGRGIYSIGGEIVVDRICKFENISEEMTEVLSTVGIEQAIELPRAKGGHRPKKAGYKELMSDSDREEIRARFADEIERLGYSF